MRAYPSVFGVGVGQSLDNPSDAAVVLFVDRKKFSGRLPDSIQGQRVHPILMDRLHVTRSHGEPSYRNGCLADRPSNLIPVPDFTDGLKLPD